MIAIPTLRRGMHALETKKGEFSLFALVARTDNPTRYDLVVSASWLDGGKLKATSEFVSLMVSAIGNDWLRDVSRVSTLDYSHPLVQFFVRTFPVIDGELRLRSTDLLAFQIEEAVLLQSRKRDSEKMRESKSSLSNGTASRKRA